LVRKNGQFSGDCPSSVATRFKPGNTSGKNGRRGSRTTKLLTNALKHVLTKPAVTVKMAKELCEMHGVDPTRVSVADIIAYSHVGHAMNGEGQYMKEMFNRIEGRTIEVVVQPTGKMGLSDMMNEVAKQLPEIEGE
jgi:hypothetical protein